MSKIFITKAKVLKDRVEILYLKHSDAESDNDSIKKCSEESSDPPHEKLIKAFEALSIHAAVENEFVDPSEITDITTHKDENFICTGFTIQGGEEMKSIVISARKKISTGKYFGFNTPPISFKDQSDQAYEFLTELATSVKHVQNEVLLYLGGKVGKKTQTNMFDKDAAPDPVIEDVIALKRKELGLAEDETNEEFEAWRIANKVPGTAKKIKKASPKKAAKKQTEAE